jgi:hypothetical protein
MRQFAEDAASVLLTLGVINVFLWATGGGFR